MNIAIIALAAAILYCSTLEVASKKYKGLQSIGTWVHTKDGKTISTRGPEGRSGAASGAITSRFLISTSKAPWEEATVMCPVITNNEGHLVRIESEDEDAEVHKYIRSAAVRKVNELIWTDGVGTEGAKWVWNTNSEALTYNHFRIPPGPGGFLAFRSTSNSPKGYEWVPMYDSSVHLYYLCEIEEKGAAPAEEPEPEPEPEPVPEEPETEPPTEPETEPPTDPPTEPPAPPAQAKPRRS